MIGKPTTAVEVFYSYAPQDEPLRRKLEKHLSIFKRQRLITDWHYRKVTAGAEWECEVDSHLNTAQLILLLVSPDFIASDYCYDIEVKRAMERHEAGEACVIPVILRPAHWEEAVFGKLQALPVDGKPVTRWRTHDEAFFNVAEGIRKAIKELTSTYSPPHGTTRVAYYKHFHEVPEILWSPDSRHVASLDSHGAIQILNVAAGESFTASSSLGSQIMALAWSPDGRCIAFSMQADNTVQVWDATMGNELYTYRGHAAPVHTIAWSPNGMNIASMSVDGATRVWQVPGIRARER